MLSVFWAVQSKYLLIPRCMKEVAWLACPPSLTSIAVDHSHHLTLQLTLGGSFHCIKYKLCCSAPEGTGASGNYSLYIKAVFALYQATGASCCCC